MIQSARKMRLEMLLESHQPRLLLLQLEFNLLKLYQVSDLDQVLLC